ncbi:MAG TPA: hypothetical protein VN896_09020 [Methylomirabilota bacterium]|nr:hypothetical protein [Methylomirabilota bacterium]
MSGKTWTFLLLFLVSVGLGVGIGEWYFKLFLKAVPPVALSQFNSQAAHVVYWIYGAGVGVAMFVWALIGVAVSKLSSGSKSSERA